MNVVEPTEFVRKFSPWSISKVNVAKQCPHRFYLQYVVKRKTGLPATSEALVGRAVHTMLENITKGYQLEAATRLAIQYHRLTTPEIETVEGFVPAVTKFLRRIEKYRELRNLGNLQSEKKWAISFDGKPLGYWAKTGVFLRGAVDLSAVFNTKPYALLIDHKTGKWKALDEYRWQFAAYKLLLKAHYPHIQKVQVGVNHLFTETIDMHKELDDVRDVSAMLSAFIEYVNQQTRTTYNHKVTRRGPLCDWCDFKIICPAHAEQNGQGK